MKTDLGPVVAVSCLVFVACGGGLSRSALDARATEHTACEAKPEPERIPCIERMTPMHEGEPADKCAAYVEGQGWSTQAAPRCMSDLPNDRELALTALAGAGACLRAGRSEHANASGASKGCFSQLERERAARLVDQKREAEEKASGERAFAQKQASAQEARRASDAEALIRGAIEECRKGLLERNSKCDEAKLTDDERKACADSCSKTAHEEADRTFAVALGACVDTFVETGTAKDCPVRRPADGFMAGAEFDKRIAACATECKKRGTTARAERQRETARENCFASCAKQAHSGGRCDRAAAGAPFRACVEATLTPCCRTCGGVSTWVSGPDGIGRVGACETKN